MKMMMMVNDMKGAIRRLGVHGKELYWKLLFGKRGREHILKGETIPCDYRTYYMLSKLCTYIYVTA